MSEDQACDLKGKRHLPCPARKRGTPASKRGRSKVDWINAVTARDRSGSTRELVLMDFNAKELLADLAPSLRRDAILCTDGSPVYTAFAKDIGIEHESVNVSAGGRVRKSFHVQNVNVSHGRLKGWIEHFHGVGTYYIPNYLGWHRMLGGHQTSITPARVLRIAAGRDHYQPIPRSWPLGYIQWAIIL